LLKEKEDVARTMAAEARDTVDSFGSGRYDAAFADQFIKGLPD